MNDDDIDRAVRGFRSTVDEPAADALARARTRALTGGAAARRTERRVGRWVVLPAVATAVAAAAVTASLVLGQTPAPVAQPTIKPAAPTTPPPPTPAQIIEAWATELESGTPAPASAPGQHIAYTARLYSGGEWTTQPGGLAEREGLIIVDSPANDGRQSFQDYIADQRAEFAATGPSWRMPTVGWLDTLDASPAGLRQACGAACHDDQQTWSAVEDLVSKADLVLPPRVRAGLLRLLGTIDGVTVSQATVDGQTLRIVAHPDESRAPSGTMYSYATNEIYIDPTTGRFAGTGVLGTARLADLPQCPMMGTDAAYVVPTADECYAPVPIEPVRTSITLWQQTLTTP